MILTIDEPSLFDNCFDGFAPIDYVKMRAVVEGRSFDERYKFWKWSGFVEQLIATGEAEIEHYSDEGSDGLRKVAETYGSIARELLGEQKIVLCVE